MEIWKGVAEATNASMAAGELVAFIGGKHVSLGRKVGENFTFTPAGQEIRERLSSEAIVAAAKAEANPKGKGRKGKVVAAVPVDEPVDELAADDPAPLDPADGGGIESEEDALDRELSLALGDDVSTAEAMG